MHRIKPPLSGAIEVAKIQKAFFEHLGLLAVTSIGEEASDILPAAADRTFRNHLYLLSPLWDTETVTYKRLIETYGGRRPYRLMAILEFSDIFAEGFGITVFGKDIEHTMNKKVRRFYDMVSGNGCPPFAPDMHDAPHFVPAPD